MSIKKIHCIAAAVGLTVTGVSMVVSNTNCAAGICSTGDRASCTACCINTRAGEACFDACKKYPR